MNFEPILLGKNIEIEEGVTFGNNVVIYDNVHIQKGTTISHNCIIGDSDMRYFKNKDYKNKKTVIGKNSFIRPNTLISQDVIIGDNFQSGDKVLIRSGATIGNNCSIGTMCDLQGNLTIGNNVRFHSNVHIGMKTIIEDYVWIYPFVVVTNDPHPPLGKLLSTRICEYSQIASNTILMPGLNIGKSSFVGCNSLVTKDVEEEAVVYGSPAKRVASVCDLKDSDGNQYLPWQNFKE
jgi:acetyltransferase-like isoleucine patch superfamily enzyme